MIKESKVHSSVRSAMVIVKALRRNQAPLGAACCGLVGESNNMPLLAELEQKVGGWCGYKHAAPSGANCHKKRSERSSVRSVMYIVKALRWNQAPLGAAWY